MSIINLLIINLKTNVNNIKKKTYELESTTKIIVNDKIKGFDQTMEMLSNIA